MRKLIFFISLLLSSYIDAQELYFPPRYGSGWATASPGELSWCADKIDPLYGFLEERSTKAFIVLKDGRIVMEKYFDSFTVDSFWYWASAGKTLTAFTIGIAQREGFLKLGESTSAYLGEGWTACAVNEENKIRILDQLQMTSGLADEPDAFCTDPVCLSCIAAPGTRWAYHNAPYTLLDQVIEEATGRNLNTYVNQKIGQPTGMSGLFVRLGFNNVFFSTPRSMARFGLLVLNKGVWEGTDILQDDVFFEEMVNTSQPINPAYGYLWWLNGKEKFMLPQSQFVFTGSLFPNAPDDMIAALGANGQVINVVPSQNLVVVRMGNAPDNNPVSYLFVNEMWMFLNEIICETTPHIGVENTFSVHIYPNPTDGELIIDLKSDHYSLSVQDISGKILKTMTGLSAGTTLYLGNYPPGLYIIEIVNKYGVKTIEKIILN